MDDNDASQIDQNDDVPFAGPDPDEDRRVADRPETDGDIDAQEYYDEGLAGAAELDDDMDGDDFDNPHLPDGFHIE